VTLPLTPSSPFVAFTTAIPSAVLNAWRVAINSACDGVGGGVYTPTVTLEINGQGLYADPFGGYVRSTWTLTIDSGGSFITNAGATATFNSAVSFNGNTQFDGSTNTVTAGTWGFYAPCYVLGGTELKIGDSIAGVGHFVIDGSGSGAGSTMLLDGNATCTFATGTELLINHGASVSLDGTLVVETDGAVTQAGPITKTGANGYTIERVLWVTTTTTTTTTVSIPTPHAYDQIICDGVPTNTGTVTLAFGAAPSFSVRVRVSLVGGSSGGTYLITGTQFPANISLGGEPTMPGWVEFLSVLMPAGVSTFAGTWQWVPVSYAAGS
jgi:hypothetical protein